MWEIFRLMHLFGLAFGVGAVTVNLILMMKSRSNKEFAPVFMKASKSIATLVFLGLILLTLSGIGFAALGYPEKQLLLVKHVLIAVLWGNGLFVVFSLSPKLTKLAPKPGQPPTQEFLSIQRQVQVMGILGIILWYTITVMSVWL